MPDIDISQVEAEALIAMPKYYTQKKVVDFPPVNFSMVLPIESFDGREQFLLDVGTARIKLSKIKYQTRARHSIVLVRLDVGGAPHRNPDDEVIPCPHLHLYREGYGDKWASRVDPTIFTNTADMWSTMQEFMNYCNIKSPPTFQRSILP